MGMAKRCRHVAGLTGKDRERAARRCGCAWIGDLTIDGVRRYVNLGPDETDARATLHRLHADNLQGRATRLKPGREFSKVAASYMAAVEASPGSRPNATRTTRSRVKAVAAWWGDVPVDGITIEHVRRFLDDAQHRYAPNTAIAMYSTFRSIMGHAQDHGLVGALPLPARARLRKVNQRSPNHLDVPTLEQVAGELPAPYDAMARFALLTGLRVGELAALTWDDVDRDAGTVHVRGTLHHDGSVGPPKTQHGKRVVTLSPAAVALLEERRPDAVGERVFPVQSLAMSQLVMRDALRRAGVYRPGLGWHAFRHGHQAVLEAAGVGLRDAAARMGHGPNFAQTASYGWAAEAGDPTDIDATITRLHHVRQ